MNYIKHLKRWWRILSKSNLKQFQIDTVKSVIKRFYEENQNRVLVADEVGLGKTLIAKGVIEEIKVRKRGKNFKVVYICSNQGLARQNMQKLSSGEKIYSADRLSMQSFKVFKLENEKLANEKGMNLIGITPETSFKFTSSQGIKEERAFIYVVLKSFTELQNISDIEEKNLKTIFRGNVKKDFEDAVNIRKNIFANTQNIEDYIEKMHNKLQEKNAIEDILQEIKQDNIESKRNQIIKKFRSLFAEISIEFLEKNIELVIIDEFQRYTKTLLENQEKNTEQQLLIEKFFKMNKLKILMLSATPFKLYATREEVISSRRRWI